uniref:Uncharacterized protein n=1 Tax=Anopheles coluzzii TaxID=1518534 RepID=A0A6E8VLB7_ANOCL
VSISVKAKQSAIPSTNTTNGNPERKRKRPTREARKFGQRSSRGMEGSARWSLRFPLICWRPCYIRKFGGSGDAGDGGSQ